MIPVTMWALAMSMNTEEAQDAVESLYRLARDLVTWPDEVEEVAGHLQKICDLMTLDSEFIKENEE